MIRDNDPKLKDPNVKLFEDSDFESDKEIKNSDKPVFYKDLYREALLKDGNF